MTKFLQIANIIALAATIAINYISNTGAFNNTTISDISVKYQNSFTPAPYAFFIWALIYIALAAFCVYQLSGLFKNGKPKEVVSQTGWWFVISCAANIAWVIAWLYDHTGLSLICMSVLAFSLMKIIINTRMELDDAPFQTIAFVWWPFSLYSGWIAVAILANLAAFLTDIELIGSQLSETSMTIILIFAAGLINIFLIWKRNMREFGIAGVWGLIAIAVANKDSSDVIFILALFMALTIFANSFIHAIKNFKHIPLIGK